MVRKGLTESPALSRVVQSAVKAAAYADSRAEIYETLRTPMTTALQVSRSISRVIAHEILVDDSMSVLFVNQLGSIAMSMCMYIHP